MRALRGNGEAFPTPKSDFAPVFRVLKVHCEEPAERMSEPCDASIQERCGRVAERRSGPSVAASERLLRLEAAASGEERVARWGRTA